MDDAGFRLTPIGRVVSPLTDPAAAPKQGHEGGPEAWLEFVPAVREGLRDLRPGDRVIVLTWLDRARRDVLVVHPRDDPANPRQGVFNTRSADRPNPIGLHPVEIVAVDGPRLRVRDLEAVDGTPVLDLKPVLRTEDEDRARLAETFDAASDTCQEARPDYPEELIASVVAQTGVRAGDRLLEIGGATGKATLPFARRGLRITCVEPGANLVAAARRNLAAYPDVTVVEARFEDWSPPDGTTFDLVFAANAWHWLEPDVRYRRAWTALRRGGHLAFWDARHVLPDDGDPIFDDLQEVYAEIGGGLPPGNVVPTPQEMPDRRDEIEASGLFDVVDVRRFDWEIRYDADGYIRLLDTFSGHIAMEEWQRDRLYAEIRRRLAERPDGLLRRHWGSVLHVARRRDG